MSTLTVDTLAGPPRTGRRIELDRQFTLDGDVLVPGGVLQTVTVRSDVRATFSSPNSGNGTTLSALALTLTPKRADSTIVCRWMINGEMHHDNIFLIHRNGVLAPGGQNASLGNTRSSGYAAAFYDHDQNSTPSNWFIMYFNEPGSTTQVSYAPAVRSSSGTNYTFALNRTLNGSTGDAYESGVSVGVAIEVAKEGV